MEFLFMDLLKLLITFCAECFVAESLLSTEVDDIHGFDKPLASQIILKSMGVDLEKLTSEEKNIFFNKINWGDLIKKNKDNLINQNLCNCLIFILDDWMKSILKNQSNVVKPKQRSLYKEIVKLLYNGQVSDLLIDCYDFCVHDASVSNPTKKNCYSQLVLAIYNYSMGEMEKAKYWTKKSVQKGYPLAKIFFAKAFDPEE